MGLENDFKHTATTWWPFFLVTLLVGISSGLLGMSLALLLHYMQHLAFGYSLSQLVSDESFLQGVQAADAQRRIFVLVLCGLMAGIGWTVLDYFGSPLVSVEKALRSGQRMPVIKTIIHALLQIITIAMGSPLGRESAPREVGALCATYLSSRAGLSPQQTKVMLACGAGAGLAAVYNVPFAGALFVMEVLLQRFSWSILVPAMATSTIAAVVSWVGLGNEAAYRIAELNSLNASLMIWSIFMSPLFGLAGFGFIHWAEKQKRKAFAKTSMLMACLLNFTLIGCLGVYFPSLLGNGKSAAQLEFVEPFAISLSALLLLLRSLIVWSSLRVGARGGLLTPSLANGALLGVVLGGLWNWIWPQAPLQAFALIGATAFLAAAQKMPLVAIVIIFEFTRASLIFIVPILFAVCGAVGTCAVLKNYMQNK